jgi:hypothetical protein
MQRILSLHFKYYLLCSWSMKYLIPILLISLYFNYTQYRKNRLLEAQALLVEDSVNTQKSSLNKTHAAHNKRSQQTHQKLVPVKKTSPSEMIAKKEFRETFDEPKEEFVDEDSEMNMNVQVINIGDVETRWIEDLQEFMEIDMGLNAKEFGKYLEVRVRRQEAIDKFFLPKLEEAKELQGKENATYMHTIEDSVELGKINQKFIQRLKKELGPEAYKAYNSFRAKFNNRLVKENSHGYIIDF